MKAIAPGKLILSGEHAVVYGEPALAIAVNRFAQASFSGQASSLISFDSLNLSYQKSHTFSALRRIKRRLQKDYQAFLRGEYGIRDVLNGPIELTQFVFCNLLDKFNIKPQENFRGFKLSTSSTIPMGCGMGSSAAMILCILHVIDQHLNLKLTKENYLTYGKEAENLQHGYSSGLDLEISLTGGCLRYQNGKAERCPMPLLPLYLVNTGQPISTTGECVTHVAPYFEHESIKSDFRAVTNQFDEALKTGQSFMTLREIIKENHRLLVTIGVVPDKVKQFIADVEATGAAAKICGAGAVRGQQGGIVLIAAEENPESICRRHHYVCNPVEVEAHGLRIL